MARRYAGAVTATPTDSDLLRFARSLIGDETPYLDTEGLEVAIREHRDLWSKLYLVSTGLGELDELRPVD
jgi:hypothetical protein